jgi:hypothetical protein
MVIYGADTVTIDRNARDFKLPDQFEWNGRPGSASRTAALFGDPSKPGLYVQVTKRGPNDWSQPHSHPNERFITVLAGTFLIGTGAKFDKNSVRIDPRYGRVTPGSDADYIGADPDFRSIDVKCGNRLRKR